MFNKQDKQELIDSIRDIPDYPKPSEAISESYSLEYGEDELEMHDE